eukprot:Plantae.Rhodophyta-Hildenbrandia_rubra.ctg9889.p1 GENE.Plantae.Rhodophyta-Hildenbrandia_rubra.ctg9889~~Plantae.Rhodophyta-Hildenbrandia_rubra.ctg9889.p1  ORF type:complete len:138 (-),score=21.36 Plantae.Rhodophyta-Hildenbrandia_rubra.ctg9889:150-563(-)
MVIGLVIRLIESPLADSLRCFEVAMRPGNRESSLSAFEIAKEIAWLRRLLNEFGHDQRDRAIIYEDNQSRAQWARDAYGAKAKHIDVKHHCSRDQADDGAMQLAHCPADRMLADALTKPLGGAKLKGLRAQLGVTEY